LKEIYNFNLISNFFWIRVAIYLSLDSIKDAKLQENPSLLEENIQQFKDKLLFGSYLGAVLTPRGDPDPVRFLRTRFRDPAAQINADPFQRLNFCPVPFRGRFTSWIRIRIHIWQTRIQDPAAQIMRIHADPDPDPDPKP
jgi:hypothetical protein